MAEMYQMEVEKIKEVIAAEDIKGDLKLKAAVDLIKEAAVITEKAPEEAKEESDAE